MYVTLVIHFTFLDKCHLDVSQSTSGKLIQETDQEKKSFTTHNAIEWDRILSSREVSISSALVQERDGGSQGKRGTSSNASNITWKMNSKIWNHVLLCFKKKKNLRQLPSTL